MDPPEDLQRSQHGGYDVADRVDLGHGDQRELDGPGETQDDVLQDGAVVIRLQENVDFHHCLKVEDF